ncbi:MAG: hypothetical protein WC868_05510 [Bacteroidales bacterium]
MYIFLFTNLFGFSQSDSSSTLKNEDKKVIFCADISYYTNFDLNFKDGFSFTTAAVIKNDKHSISVAPVWWIDKNRKANFFKGGMLSYKFSPSNRNKQINFYFIYDLVYTFEKNKWDKNMEYSPKQFYNVSFISRWHSLKNQVGYGFELNIYKGFYVNQSMSVGIEFYNYKSKTDVKDNASLSSEYSSGNIFSNVSPCGFLKIGIGYNFEK